MTIMDFLKYWHSNAPCFSVAANTYRCFPSLYALTGAQYLLAHPGQRNPHDTAQATLVVGHQQTGQWALKQATRLDFGIAT